MRARSTLASVMVVMLVVVGLLGSAAAEAAPACKRTVHVTDHGDDGSPAQLRAALASVCAGGRVLIASGTVTLSDELVLDLVSKPEDTQAMELAFGPQGIAWPIVAGPGIPADRVAILQKAFMDTMKDKEFLAEAKRMRMDVDPISAQDAKKVIERMYGASKEAIAKIRPIMVPIKK